MAVMMLFSVVTFAAKNESEIERIVTKEMLKSSQKIDAEKETQLHFINSFMFLPEYFVSDCGEIWECTSGCENLTSHQRTLIRNLLSDLCGTDITEVTIYL